jgi:hypothetical protein
MGMTLSHELSFRNPDPACAARLWPRAGLVSRDVAAVIPTRLRGLPHAR